MKILYLGDGRGRANWGANATSTALYSILADKHTVFDSIMNADLGYKVPFCSIPLLGGIFKFVAYRKDKLSSIVRKTLVKRGALLDYISQDVDATAKRFMVLKQQYPQLQAIYNKIQACEAIVLNAEGS